MASFENISSANNSTNTNDDNNSNDIEEDETELLFLAISAYWNRNETSFSNWWLSLNDDARRNILIQIVPDMPLNPNQDNKVTDRILPELTQSGLLACEGKLLLLFIKRRFSTEDSGFQGDIIALTKMFTDGQLPNIGGLQLDQLDLPFVDPCDPDENIRSLSKNTSPEARLKVVSHLSTCRLVHASVWLCLRLRRSTIAGFLTNLIVIHEENMTDKPSPSFNELLKGEKEQLKYFNNEEKELLKESATLEECD